MGQDGHDSAKVSGVGSFAWCECVCSEGRTQRPQRVPSPARAAHTARITKLPHAGTNRVPHAMRCDRSFPRKDGGQTADKSDVQGKGF